MKNNPFSIITFVLLHLLFSSGPGDSFAQGDCNFNWSVQSGNCVLPVQVNFNLYNPPGSGDYYVWNFGDNTTPVTTASTSVNHSYSSGGPFWVAVTAYDTANEQLCYQMEWQNPVQSNSIPGIECSAWEYISCPGDMLNFRIKRKSGGGKVLQWDFGDGTVVPGSNDEMLHAYDNPGNYVVTVTYNDDQCGAMLIQVNFVVSTNYKFDLAPDLNTYGGFTPNDSLCPGDEVEIMVGGGGTYYWDMGDGNTVINNEATKKHSYSDTGNYTVTVINTNGCGFSDTVSGVLYVGNNIPVTTNYFDDPQISPNPACPNDKIVFDFYNTDQYAGFLWNFGDGTYDSLNNRISHSYASIGTKNVSLTVYNGCGMSAVFNYPVSITTGLPITLDFPPGFSLVFPDTACPGDKLFFLTPTTGVLTYTWNFGDGNSSSTPFFDTGEDMVIFDHIYANTGTYSATLTVTNGCGSSDNATFPVLIGNNAPVQTVNLDGAEQGFLFFSFIADGGDEPIPPCSPVGFWGFSGNSFSWDFGDGSAVTSNANITYHSFSSPGTYTVQLTTTNSCGNSRTFSSDVFIDGECLYACPFTVAVSVTNATCGNSDGSASVTASDGYPPYQFTWSNGSTTFTATGLAAGLHYVAVQDSLGCITYATAEISDGTGPVITVNSKNDVSCYGLSDGSIDISVSGGTPPYVFQWSDGSSASDRSNLTGGTYVVVVTDAGTGQNCIAAKAVTITQPGAIDIQLMVASANCLASDGNAIAIASGGEAPYSYLWSTGATSSVLANLPAGNYSIAVSDANGCSVTEPVSVSNNNAPLVTLNSLVNTDCASSTIGAIDVNVNGGSTPYTYSWSNGSSTQDISSLDSGTYLLTVTDAAGCLGTANYTVEFSPPGEPSICMITVDSATGKNIVVWEPVAGVAAYKIYKEITQANVYVYIDSIPDSGESEYFDLSADPKKRSWRYRLSAVDACGNESNLSPLHKTMHLTVNKGINDEANLIWDHYEGFPFSTYIIGVRTPFTPWKLLDSIPNNLSSFTDFSPPDTAPLIVYQVRAVLLQPCTTGKIKTYNASKSNTATMTVDVGMEEINPSGALLEIFPNPFSKTTQIICSVPENASSFELNISDVMGRTVKMTLGKFPQNGIFRFRIGRENMSNGVYILQMSIDGAVTGTAKLIVTE